MRRHMCATFSTFSTVRVPKVLVGSSSSTILSRAYSTFSPREFRARLSSRSLTYRYISTSGLRYTVWVQQHGFVLAIIILLTRATVHHCCLSTTIHPFHIFSFVRKIVGGRDGYSPWSKGNENKDMQQQFGKRLPS